MAYDSLFKDKYRLLLKYKRKYGTIDFPSKPGKSWLDKLSDKQVSELRMIGRFVETLRRQYKIGELQEYKIDMLNHINFNWTPKSKNINYENWLSNIRRLKIFKENNGHCNVPENWEKDAELAAFVVSSRICYRRGKLSELKIIELEKIGFKWTIGNLKKARDKKGRFISEIE